MEFFSDRELGRPAASKNEIDIPLWNGLVAIIEGFIANNSLAKDFPKQCPDGRGICGCNTELLFDKAMALIPKAPSILRMEKTVIVRSDFEFSNSPTTLENSVDTYGVLDLLEFCYNHLYDPVHVGEYHEFFDHFHLAFKSTGLSKLKFRTEVNLIFERNGIGYSLNEEGKIVRIIPEELTPLVTRKFLTKDATLNELLTEASKSIMQPKVADRVRALEKLWDAFERAKTFYSADKKISSTQLLQAVSSGSTLMQTHLTSEAKALTDIGNQFQIRHFETDKEKISDVAHIDYLFFRMFSMIDLFIKELEA